MSAQSQLPASSHSFDAIVIGGGVAGLSVAAALTHRAAVARVLLLEREPLLASHASGHNAAIYRPLEDDSTSSWLAERSLQLLDAWLGVPLLSCCGLLLVSSELERTGSLAAHAAQLGVAHRRLTKDELPSLDASLRGGEATAGLLLTSGGVLDIHALTSGLARVIRERGGELRCAASVERIETAGSRVTGVRLQDGTSLQAGSVFLCAGAWAGELARRAGSPVSLLSVRRHLVQLRPKQPVVADGPVVWRLEDEVYYRPESGGLLASPCDATPWRAEVPPSDPSALLTLAAKLERLAPPLAASAVARSWACLRTFASDRELVVGPDPAVAGLHWLGGLGGRGMSVAVAAGELVAAAALGELPTSLPPTLSASRFEAPARSPIPDRTA